MSPKLVNKMQRRGELAERALDVFAEKGFDAASISMIARRAGVGKGTLYEYFDSKEEIFFHALESWVQQIETLTESPFAPDDDPVDRLFAYAHSAMAAFIDDDRSTRIFLAIFQMLLGDHRGHDHKDFMERMLQGHRLLMRGILLDGVATGAFRPEIAADVDLITSNLLAYLDAMGLYFYVDRDRDKLMKHIDFHLHNLVRGLLVHSDDQNG